MSYKHALDNICPDRGRHKIRQKSIKFDRKSARKFVCKYISSSKHVRVGRLINLITHLRIIFVFKTVEIFRLHISDAHMDAGAISTAFKTESVFLHKGHSETTSHRCNFWRFTCVFYYMFYIQRKYYSPHARQLGIDARVYEGSGYLLAVLDLFKPFSSCEICTVDR
jgi:hypothetical protein